MSSNSAATRPGAAMSSCCSSTMMLAALGLSFACCFLLVLVFLCLRFFHLVRRSRRHGARLLQGQQPKPGLDAAAIALLPSFPYRPRDGCSADSAPGECAVCLSAVGEGEMVRQIPGCEHVFHQGCIDVWLLANTSCPVCRGKAEPASAAARAVVERAGASACVVPVEMLDDGMVASTSSSTSGAVLPRPERLGALPSGTGQGEDLERQ